MIGFSKIYRSRDDISELSLSAAMHVCIDMSACVRQCKMVCTVTNCGHWGRSKLIPGLSQTPCFPGKTSTHHQNLPWSSSSPKRCELLTEHSANTARLNKNSGCVNSDFWFRGKYRATNYPFVQIVANRSEHSAIPNWKTDVYYFSRMLE